MVNYVYDHCDKINIFFLFWLNAQKIRSTRMFITSTASQVFRLKLIPLYDVNKKVQKNM